MSVETLNFLVALGSVGMQVAALLLLALFFVRDSYPTLARLVGRWGVWFALGLTVASIGMALYYSEVLGFVPCSLCWLQRLFLFPQAVLFVVALVKRETARIADYAIWLSVLGGIVALYQHTIQMIGFDPLPCLASGGDCVKRILFEFEYITFPFVSFSAFALLVVVMLFVRRQQSVAR